MKLWRALACSCGLLAAVAADPARAQDARVVLLGAAAREPSLIARIEESLRAAGFSAPIEHSEASDCQSWDLTVSTDERVLLCIACDDAHHAVVSVRGPSQQAPQTRALSLDHGLDEVGRETIAHVVELALASRSELSPLPAATADTTSPPPQAAPSAPPSAPLSAASPRAEPRARRISTPAAAAQREPVPAPDPSYAEETTPRAATQDYAFDARGSLSYAGPALALRWAVGAELARVIHRGGRSAQSVELAVDYGLPTRLHADVATAHVQTSALRLGADCALSVSSNQRVALGVSAALELAHISRVTVDTTWQPAQSQHVWTSSLRAELRYMVSLGALRLSAGAFVDCALQRLRFQAESGEEHVQLASSWRMQPGVLLALGF